MDAGPVQNSSPLRMESMKDPETATIFVGFDRRTDTELPGWYAERNRVSEPVSRILPTREHLRQQV